MKRIEFGKLFILFFNGAAACLHACAIRFQNSLPRKFLTNLCFFIRYFRPCLQRLISRLLQDIVNYSIKNKQKLDRDLENRNVKKNIGHNKAARETKPTFFCSSRTRAAYTAGTDAVIYSISVSVYSYFFRFTFIAYPSSLLVRGAIPSIQQQQKKKKSISSSRDLEVRSNS